MSWDTVKFDWNQARAFLVTAREGSLSAAAQELGLTQPTLSRQVSGLEESIGVVLFEKFGRGLALTPAGRELLVHVEKMGDSAANFSLSAKGKSQSLGGSVCISSPEITSALMMPQIVEKILLEYPLIKIDLMASNVPSDLRRREADIAIRSFRPNEPEYIAKKVQPQKWGVYAANSYCEKRGEQSSETDIEDAVFIGPSDTAILIEHMGKVGVRLTEKNFKITSDSMLVQWQLLCTGYGIAVAPVKVADRNPSLTRLLADKISLESEQWLVSHKEMRSNKKVRVVFDFLAAELGPK